MRSWLILPMMAAAGMLVAPPAAMAYGKKSEAKAMKISPALKAAVAASHRSEASKARDKYRNPAETLAFFGVKPTHTVVELWPGGGWYTEILAPYLSEKGKLIVAPPQRGEEGLRKVLDSNSAVFGKAIVAHFPGTTMGGQLPVPSGSADVVLTFRNAHNWKMGSYHPDKVDYSEAAFKEIYAMLKPGGILGIEDHRLNEDADSALESQSGYIKVSTLRAMVEKAGFKFAGSSEINANPKDTKDHPKGVWTLPPRLAEGDTDREKYLAIGESDRMTLKFIKPAKKK